MMLALASVVFLGSESLGTRDHILLSQIRDFLLVASYDSQGHGGGIRPRLHAGSGNSVTAFTSLTITLHRPHGKHRLYCCWRHRLRVRVFTEPLLRNGLHNPVVPQLLGADDIENTASSIVPCLTVFTKLLPCNMLIKCYNIYSHIYTSRYKVCFFYVPQISPAFSSNVGCATRLCSEACSFQLT
jgi:hypothetical protein